MMGLVSPAGALVRAAGSPPPTSLRHYPYFAAATVVAAALAALALGPAASTIPTGDPAVWIVAAAVLAGELLPIRLPRKDDLEEIALSTPFALALLVLAGPLPAIAVYVAAGLLHDAVDRVSPLKALFNGAQYCLSLAAGAAVLLASGASLEPGALRIEEHLPAMLVACAAVFAVNQVLVGIGTALVTGRRIRDLVLGELPFQVWTAGFVLAMAPLVVVAAEREPLLVPLFFFPVLAIRTGGRQAVLNVHRALHDDLTGLPNRAFFNDRAHDAIERAARGGGAAVVSIIDLNGFKAVNDTLGHEEGDRLLRQVAQRLGEVLPAGATLARLGGDEFAVVLEVGDHHDAPAAVARLLHALDEPFGLDGLAVHVDACAGVAASPRDGAVAHDLLKHADVALYWAKARHTAIEPYDAADDDYSIDRLALAGQLSRGIDRGELVVHFQPKIACTPGRRDGVEALVRWEHPQLGLIGPAGFVPLAERSSLLKPLTEYVLGRALEQCGRWLADGLDLRVSVNVSARTLLDDELPADVARLLERTGVPASNLQIEITESRIVAEDPRAERVLTGLQALGVGLAIDDFGTGFSSLAQLQRLPVDEIKIDKSFVLNMATSADDAAIVRSTIELGRTLELDVTAEGVETPEACRELAALGCDYVQGFHLGRPGPAESCVREMRRFHRGVEHA